MPKVTKGQSVVILSPTAQFHVLRTLQPLTRSKVKMSSNIKSNGSLTIPNYFQSVTETNQASKINITMHSDYELINTITYAPKLPQQQNIKPTTS